MSARTILIGVSLCLLSACGNYQAQVIPHEDMIAGVYEDYIEQKRIDGNRVDWLAEDLAKKEEGAPVLLNENEPTIEETDNSKEVVPYVAEVRDIDIPYLQENIAAAKYCVGKEGSFAIRPKYAHIEALGKLFTAYRCGPARLHELPGIRGDMYTAGSVITLKKTPSASLLLLLDKLGYTCSKKVAAPSCKTWTLTREQTVTDMMRLELFIDEMDSDDCVHC